MDFYRLKREAIDSYVRCFDHFFKKVGASLSLGVLLVVTLLPV
jgi:hypothetical protein